jgi:hypothetical protein
MQTHCSFEGLFFFLFMQQAARANYVPELQKHNALDGSSIRTKK